MNDDITVLYFDNINENYYDPRTNPASDFAKSGQGRDIRFGYLSRNQGNNSNRYGNQLRSSINLGAGYSVEITDYDTEVAVRVSYSNAATGRGASRTFLIVFDLSQKGGKGVVKCNAVKWRSISDISQAASYIRGCAQALSSYTNSGN